MKHRIKFIGLALMLCSAVIHSNIATATTSDFVDHGTFLVDKSSGLKWLDLTLTYDKTYDYVGSQFGSGGEYEGWRFATFQEFDTMVFNYSGYTPDPQPHAVTLGGSKIETLVYIMGDIGALKTVNLGGSPAVGEGLSNGYLFTDDPNPFAPIIAGWIQYHQNPNSNLVDFVISGDAIFDRNGRFNSSFLVKTVPMPASIWLMGSGLLSLIGFSRRKIS